MDMELQTRLSKLEDDVRSGRLDRAALFWLKIFTDLSAEAVPVRSSRWVEASLEAAQQVPGLMVTALSPRRELVGNYDLFRFIRLEDGQVFDGEALAELDWQRKYHVELLPSVADSFPKLQSWTERLWAELGGVPEESAALEEVLAQHASRGETALLEVLHEAQALFGGWLPKAVVERVAARLEVPTADVYGVTEFYEMFHTRPVGRKLIRICQDAPCALAGASTLMDSVCQHLGVEPGDTTDDGEYTVEQVRCLGLCDRAPAALVNLDRYGNLDPAAPEALLNDSDPVERLAIGGLVKLALSNVGVVDPNRLKEYIAQGGLA